MINSTDFRTGLTIEIDGGVWQIVDFQHVKPGKGAAFVRTKIKNVETGAVVERTFNPNEKMPAAHLETRNMQYLYEADGMYTFMDTETYEQTELNKEQLGDALNYLMENMPIWLHPPFQTSILCYAPTPATRPAVGFLFFGGFFIVCTAGRSLGGVCPALVGGYLGKLLHTLCGFFLAVHAHTCKSPTNFFNIPKYNFPVVPIVKCCDGVLNVA